MRHTFLLSTMVLLIILTTQACDFSLLGKPTQVPVDNTVFSGRALVDINNNRMVDASDAPLEGAHFTAAGFGEDTDSNGYAIIIIPGVWDRPTKTRMTPPAGNGYTLIGQQEVFLQSGKQTDANFLFSATHTLPTPVSSPLPSPTINKPEITPTVQVKNGVERNLTYCITTNGVDMVMDIYYPKNISNPAPVVVLVHGGGWKSGNKNEGTIIAFTSALRDAGFIVVSINYRLAPEYKFPVEIQDVQCAIRHLRANATRYNLDPDRIGALGSSAGGHLVSLAGLAGDNPAWDIGQYRQPYPNVSGQVQAVVDLFGPTNLSKFSYNAEPVNGDPVFGAHSLDDPILLTYSPVTYVTKHSPPFLIMQGEADQIVPPSQSQELYDRLIQVGVPAQLVMVKNAGHSFVPMHGQIDPTMDQIIQAVVDFFNQHLK